MSNRRPSRRVVIGGGLVAVVAIMALPVQSLLAAGNDEPEVVQTDPIVGAWNCAIPPAGGAPAFTDIKNIHVGGTQSEIDNAAPPSQESPTVGTWTKTGRRNYSQKAYQQIWDASGTFLGTYHYTGPMTLTQSFNELNIVGEATFYDPKGNVVAAQSFPFTAHCTRL